MKAVLSLVLVFVVSTAFAANPYGNRKYYSRNGTYQGRIAPNGNRYDARGTYQGRISSNGSVYDRNNTFQGRIAIPKK